MLPQSPRVKLTELSFAQLASITDHTFLYRPDFYLREARQRGESAARLRAEKFERFLEETSAFPTIPYGLCVRPEDVERAAAFFGHERPVIVSVAGFPEGTQSLDFKLAEASLALKHGASEIDVVVNASYLRDGQYRKADAELWTLSELVHQAGGRVKLILETAERSREEILLGCRIAASAGVDFVKTSTGYAGGARVADVRLLRESFSGGVKISGGVCPGNLYELLAAAGEYGAGTITLDPSRLRIGESSLLSTFTPLSAQ